MEHINIRHKCDDCVHIQISPDQEPCIDCRRFSNFRPVDGLEPTPVLEMENDDLNSLEEPDDPADPQHYKRFKIQPTDFIVANALPWCEGNIVKYVCRHPYKNGIEDLYKAKNYINRLIEGYENGN